jgi:hypothetical protein
MQQVLVVINDLHPDLRVAIAQTWCRRRRLQILQGVVGWWAVADDLRIPLRALARPLAHRAEPLSERRRTRDAGA